MLTGAFFLQSLCANVVNAPTTPAGFCVENDTIVVTASCGDRWSSALAWMAVSAVITSTQARLSFLIIFIISFVYSWARGVSHQGHTSSRAIYTAKR
jgi:hypothetical protein